MIRRNMIPWSIGFRFCMYCIGLEICLI